MKRRPKPANDALLNKYRIPGRCEVCNRWCDLLEPHHIIHRGLGGDRHGKKNLPENIVAVGSHDRIYNSTCVCHTLIHSGNGPSQMELFALAGRRLGKSAEECRQTVMDTIRLDGKAERLKSEG